MSEDNTTKAEEPAPAPPAPTLVGTAFAFWRQARERKVVQWGVGYVVVAFGVLQGVLLFADMLDWPPTIGRVALTMLSFGLPIALVLAWSYGDRGRQRISPGEAGLIGVCATAAVAVMYFVLQAPPAPNTARPSAETTATIAVLPFDARYSGPDAQFFADGVASSIANVMSEVGMPVISQAQSSRYRGAAQANAARELGVTFLVHGAVDRDGDDMRISVQVEDAHNGVTLMTKEFAASVSQQRVVREQVAAEIAGALSWGGGSQGKAWGEQDSEVIAGIFRIRQRLAANDRMGTLEAARALARAAPQSARALVMLPQATRFAFRTIPAEDRRAAVSAARAAARRAMQLDPQLADVDVALSDVTPTYLWEEHEILLRRAMQKDPGGSLPPFSLGALLRSSGRLREAEPITMRAATLDPLWTNIIGEQIDLLMMLGRRAEAHRILERTARLWPDDPGVIFTQFDTAIASGAYDTADAILRNPATAEVIEPADGPQTHHAIVCALRTRNARDVAALVAACSDASSINRNSAYNCLIALSVVRQVDAAFALSAQMFPDMRGATPAAIEQRWLDTAGTLHSVAVLFVPQTAPMRADPRFIEIADKVGFTPYWRRHPPDFCATERAPVCDRLH